MMQSLLCTIPSSSTIDYNKNHLMFYLGNIFEKIRHFHRISHTVITRLKGNVAWMVDSMHFCTRFHFFRDEGARHELCSSLYIHKSVTTFSYDNE